MLFVADIAVPAQAIDPLWSVPFILKQQAEPSFVSVPATAIVAIHSPGVPDRRQPHGSDSREVPLTPCQAPKRFDQLDPDPGDA